MGVELLFIVTLFAKGVSLNLSSRQEDEVNQEHEQPSPTGKWTANAKLVMSLLREATVATEATLSCVFVSSIVPTH